MGDRTRSPAKCGIRTVMQPSRRTWVIASFVKSDAAGTQRADRVLTGSSPVHALR